MGVKSKDLGSQCNAGKCTDTFMQEIWIQIPMPYNHPSAHLMGTTFFPDGYCYLAVVKENEY